MSGAVRGVVLGVAIAGSIAGCIVKKIGGPRLTGTCDGACAHYIECKPGHSDRDRERCRVECPDSFGDRDSLMAYESLSCKDAVEYVDGTEPHTSRNP
ncbi:MAG TPA: hypothetical protein VLX92_03330 [Kofleriaceae bacterium]|nr:hypothetical protein [Kofleriaceae bacterium]